jgi:hypothetical protein
MAEFEEARQMAISNGDNKGMTAASQAKAQLAGYWINKSESKRIDDPNTMRTTEQDAMIVALVLAGRIGAAEAEQIRAGNMPMPLIDGRPTN